MRKQWIIWIVAAAVVATAFVLRRKPPQPNVAPWAYAPADTSWVTVEGVEFPTGMQDAPPEVIEAYVFAAKHPEVLHYVPCFCGCEDPRIAHESNYDCFVDAIDRSGSKPRVSPDPMGFS